MNGKTIKTLAEYIAKLHKDNDRRENFKEYADDKFDTNGVEQDHIETFWPPDVRSGAKP
jgi:hypothetical protein